MVNFLDKISDSSVHLDQLDKAIETHKLTDVLEVHSNALEIKPGRVNQDIERTKIDLSDADKRKKQILKELEKELLFLGMKEGRGMETRDIGVKSDDIDYRGTFSKEIKSGLVMEYTFSSQSQHIKNFTLNSVEMELASIPEDKLLKLYIITKFFNSVYRLKKKEIVEEILSDEEIARQKLKEEAEKKKQLVLEQL